MQRDAGSGDRTPGTPSPTHGGRLRHRKRSNEVICSTVYPYRDAFLFLAVEVEDSHSLRIVVIV
jgi:phosphatidate cytidylyltransferase